MGRNERRRERKKISVLSARRIRCWREAEQAGFTLCEAPLMLTALHRGEFAPPG